MQRVLTEGGAVTRDRLQTHPTQRQIPTYMRGNVNSFCQSHGRIEFSWILAWQISKFWVENEEDIPSTANCIIIAQILHFPLSFSGAVLQITPAQSGFQ
jgi:hypothetical protein